MAGNTEKYITKTYTIKTKDYKKYFHANPASGDDNLFVNYLYAYYHDKTKLATKYKNYLLVTKGGKVFTQFTNAYSYLLSTYIEQKLGFDTLNFKIDKDTWKLIEDSSNKNIDNRTETKALNAICTKTKHEVAIGKWNFILVHSSADYLEDANVHKIADIYNDIALQLEIFGFKNDRCKNIAETVANNSVTISFDRVEGAQDLQPYYTVYLVNEKGDTYYHQSSAGITLKDMLEAYMRADTVNLDFSEGLTIDSTTWNDLVTNDIKNNLPLLVKTFNALCKKQKYRIAVCAVQPKQTNDGICIFPKDGDYWSADKPLSKL